MNWDLVTKEYKKLKMPKGYYHCIEHHKMQGGKYIIDNSERSTGKTTSYLIYGILAFWFEHKEMVYVRQSENMIMPKYSSTLFDTVLDCDYISKITDGLYNSVVYKSRKWYLCQMNEDGEVVLKMETPFCHMLAINKHMELKSTTNLPNVELIIYDEFISDFYAPNEFIAWCDLLKTIIRSRTDVLIVMLANTINIHSPYYRELEIYPIVSKMSVGEKKLIVTDKGTVIDFLFIKNDISKDNLITGKTFFGFKNPELSAITGGAITWNFSNVQHIPKDIDFKTLIPNAYVYDYGELYRLEVVETEAFGIGVYVHQATKLYQDSIIYTHEFIDTLKEAELNINLNNVIYHTGADKFSKWLWSMLDQNKFFYDDNSTGSFIKNYISTK